MENVLVVADKHTLPLLADTTGDSPRALPSEALVEALLYDVNLKVRENVAREAQN